MMMYVPGSAPADVPARVVFGRISGLFPLTAVHGLLLSALAKSHSRAHSRAHCCARLRASHLRLLRWRILLVLATLRVGTRFLAREQALRLAGSAHAHACACEGQRRLRRTCVQ